MAVVIAALSARPYADSANDGSRLAIVESLVDHHTLAIDDSIFVRVPPPAAPPRQQPYFVAHHEELLRDGTIDKIKVGDHFYSDKPYTPSLYLAGWYQLLQWTTGLKAKERADLFCYWMTLLSSGVAYVVAVWCVYRLGRTVGLSLPLSLLLAGSLGLSTMALPYSQHVNSHILGLGVAAALVGSLAVLLRRAGSVSDRSPGEPGASATGGARTPVADAPGSPILGSGRRLVGLGILAGLGYAVEQGIGQLFWGWTMLAVIYRCGLGRGVPLFLLGSLPWMILHHTVNYAIGGTFGPANAVPAYFDYPGSAFDATNLTGHWNHANVGAFLAYAAGMLVSDRGFPVPQHSLVAAAARRRGAGVDAERQLAGGFRGGLVLSTWLLYSALSTGFSGGCMSIRWFLPLLAPGYYVLAVVLRRFPNLRGDFVVLSVWGAAEAAMMWHEGMWWGHLPLRWPLLGAALLRLGRLSRLAVAAAGVGVIRRQRWCGRGRRRTR